MANFQLPMIATGTVIASAIGRQGCYGRVSCRYVNHGNLTATTFHHPDVIGLASVYAQGNWLRDNYETHDRFNGTLRSLLVCGEYGAIMNAPTVNEARANFITGIRYFVSIVPGAAPMVRENAEVPVAGEARGALELLSDHTVGCITLINGVVIQLPRTIEEAYNLALLQVPIIADGGNLPTVTDTITMVIIALTKRSNVTSAFTTKVARSMQSQVGRSVKLNDEVIQRYYTLFTPAMSSDNIRAVFTALIPMIPAEAIVLQNMVSQAKNSGLTNYLLILQALEEHSDFEWGTVEAVKRGQFAAFRNAAVAVAGDEYYAFRQGGMGNVASTKYAVLAWTARSLLIESGDNETLRQYGGKYTPNEFPRIAAAIRTYLARPGLINNNGTVQQPNHGYWNAIKEYGMRIREYVAEATNSRNNNEQMPADVEVPNFGDEPEIQVQ